MNVTTKKSNNVFISILVSAYNAELLIERCLSSVAQNDCYLFELVIIDDGSKDATRDIIKSMLHQFDNYVFIEKDNSGLTASLQLGVAHCRGQFIMRLDADDYMTENRVKNAYVDYQNKPYDLRMSLSQKVAEDGTFQRELPRVSYRVPKSSSLLQLLEYGNFLVHGAIMVRTEILKANNYNLNYRVAQDYDLLVRLFKTDLTLIFSKEVEYFFCANAGSISSKKANLQLDAEKSICLEHYGTCNRLISSKNNLPSKVFLFFSRLYKARRFSSEFVTVKED